MFFKVEVTYPGRSGKYMGQTGGDVAEVVDLILRFALRHNFFLTRNGLRYK